MNIKRKTKKEKDQYLHQKLRNWIIFVSKHLKFFVL